MAAKGASSHARPRRASALSSQDYRLLAEFRYRLAKFLAFSEAVAQAAGLSPRQHQALIAIKGFANGAAVSVGLPQPLSAIHVRGPADGISQARRSGLDYPLRR